MAYKDLYKNDLVHRYASHTFVETTVNDETKVEFKNAGSTVIASSQKLDVIDAYRSIRSNFITRENVPFLSTTVERDLLALTTTDKGTIIDNITVGRLEKWTGTKWINVSRRSVIPNITASTTQTQGQGLLTSDVNVVTTVANDDDTVTLPIAAEGINVLIANLGQKKLQVFPNTGSDLGEGTNQGVTISKEAIMAFHCYSSTKWIMI